MGQTYRDGCRKLEQAGVDIEYLLGWQGGYLGHPKREEQRVTDAYDAGYEHGEAHDTESYQNWLKK